MRLVATTRILDEADIVEAFVRHTAAYVDHHVFVDNGSHDGTLEILKRLKDEGLGITVFQNRSVSFNEVHFNTYMFFEAVYVHEADWVLCLDADEFLDDRGVPGGLRAGLDGLRRWYPDTQCLRLPLIEYVCAADDDPAERIVPLRVRRRHAPTDNTKVFIRADLAGPEVTVAGGNHFVYLRGRTVPSRSLDGLSLAHYATRSTYQALAKITRGWAKVLAAGPQEIARGTSCHYRGVFEAMRDDPGLILNDGCFRASAEQATALIHDPIAYRGGPLTVTAPVDDMTRAIRGMTGYLEELAARHGRLIDQFPAVAEQVAQWNGDLERLL